MAYFRAFKAIMALNEQDQEDVAVVLKRSRSYVADRLRGLRPFTQEDIYKLCDEYEISYEDIPVYFPPGGKAKKGTKVVLTFDT